MARTIVVARYKEDISWTEKIKEHKVSVVEKDKCIPNFGREPHTFLWYIVTCWHQLEGDYVFCQGNPFDHAKHFLQDTNKECGGYTPIGDKILKCKPDGKPHHAGLPIDDVCWQLGLPLQPSYDFVAGGQFIVTADRIKSRPYEFYLKALYLSCVGRNPWVLERIWKTIFGDNNGLA